MASVMNHLQPRVKNSLIGEGDGIEEQMITADQMVMDEINLKWQIIKLKIIGSENAKIPVYNTER